MLKHCFYHNMDSYSYSTRSARSAPNRESEYMRNQRAEYQRLPNSRSPSPFTPRRPIPRPEPRPEPRSRSRPRESWYHEVPILGSVLRTMKDILGLYDYDYDYGYGYDYTSTGYDSRRSGKYHRYQYRNIENPRRRSYQPIDEECYRGRRNSTTQTRYGGNRCSRRYPSPSPTDRSGDRNEHKRYSYSHSNGRSHNRNHKMHPREPITEYIYPSAYPSVRRRSSSISSYTRSRPQIVTRSPAPPPPPSTTPSKRKVKFASPLPSAFKSFKRASIDDQTGSRKRGSSSSNPNSNTSTVRTPRPRSPVQERKPLRPGRRVSFSTGPSIIRSRSNGYEYEYGHRYGYGYGYEYPKTPIPPRSSSTSTPTHASTRYYASRPDPSISIVDAGNRALDDRGFGVLGQAGTRGSLRHQNIFEVCGDLPPAELEG